MGRTAASVVDALPERDALLDEILTGLYQRPKSLPCKLFYDERGSRLFEEICELEEYYPTRTELGILRAHALEIIGGLDQGSVLVEYGSGAGVKTRILLDALVRPYAYVPIDISRSALTESAEALAASYPELQVRPLCADYTQELELPPDLAGRPVVGFFPGSTIGNFEPRAAIQFLRRIRQLCGREGRFVIGVDLKKERSILEAAYNDEKGVTARFNANILRVINREHGGHFDVEAFRHRAVYDADSGRVEMHLVSQRRQRVRVATSWIELEENEPIVTEHCYKFDPDQFASLAAESGFDVAGVWLDARRYFSVELLVPRVPGSPPRGLDRPVEGAARGGQ